MAERVVLDAGAASAWILPTDTPEQKAHAGALIDSGATFVVPRLRHLEVAAVLMRTRRAKIVSATAFRTAIDAVKGIEIETHAGSHGFDELLALAGRYRLQPADAIYFDLARTLKLPIASPDGAFAPPAVRTVWRSSSLRARNRQVAASPDHKACSQGVG